MLQLCSSKWSELSAVTQTIEHREAEDREQSKHRRHLRSQLAAAFSSSAPHDKEGVVRLTMTHRGQKNIVLYIFSSSAALQDL